MSEIEFRAPKNSNELKEYDLFRWTLLRKPIGKSIESLKDKYDSWAFHLIGIKQGIIVACGRLHFNNLNEAQIRYMAVDNSLQKERQVSMTYRQMFDNIVATNGLHGPKRRKGPSNMKRLFAIVVMGLAVVTVGSTFV